MPAGALLVCDAHSGEWHDRAFYRQGTLPIVPCAAPAVLGRSENSITLQASTYTHAVELEGEYVFGDNYFSLLPGEQRTVVFRPAANAHTDALTVTGYTVET